MKALLRSHTSSSSSAANSSSSISSSPPSSSWIPLRALLIVSSSAPPASDGVNLKSPWSRRKRKHALSPQQWNSLFTRDGKLRDGGVKFLKKVRSGGVDPSIRAKVWPFLLGVYDLGSSEAERKDVRIQKRKEYKILRRRCRKVFRPQNGSYREVDESNDSDSGESLSSNDGLESPCSEDVYSARESLSIEELQDDLIHSVGGIAPLPDSVILAEEEKTSILPGDGSALNSESSGSESSDEPENMQLPPVAEGDEENDQQYDRRASLKKESSKSHWTEEDFATWKRIIRLDALRADEDCIYSPVQVGVSRDKACRRAEAVGLKDYDHLEPGRIYHAARLVAVLESYAIYDQEIGYCQGMSDLLSPILAVIEDNHEAFWCFVGFMRKARHNFRLDEAGIKRQLKIVSKIIKSKDSQLYKHLEKLQAEDCFFVYRMVVVLFRRELSFNQTLCLWEVMWADQAAIRAGIGKSAWGRIRPRAPPTDDLLLYAIAACVLQRRKLIIQKYSSMDEIVRECNSMSGNLDVWKLLDDAHDLVVTLHDKV